MVAAAIPQWSKVLIQQIGTGVEMEMEIEMVFNSTPRPGRITWICDGEEFEVGGNQRIVVTDLP